MKAGFYPKLALDGIRKNKRMYLPYILTCVGMVMMYYIIVFLQYTNTLDYLPGAETIRITLQFGGWVIAFFATIFLFYTNAFLIRRRKKEFGLYNILGMGKWNIGRILFCETIIIAITSLGIGLIAGIALSKLAELGLVNVLKADVTYTLKVSLEAIGMTSIVFGVIFALLFLNAIRQIKMANAISLLRSENVGEKPPKANWIFGILGVIVLGVAYYIAVTIEAPIAAIVWFFIAVVMVIIGTYLLFIAGSVLVCRILQKKKNYYYKANHFVSVSSMVYRMKRNGAGLASICILATMVLVMISSTASLYFGAEDSLKKLYPKEINIQTKMKEVEDLNSENMEVIRDAVTEISELYGVKKEHVVDYYSASVAGYLEKNVAETDSTKVNQFSLNTFENVVQFYIIPIADYNQLMNASETLEKDEILLYTYRTNYTEDTLTIKGGNTFKVKKHIDTFIDNGEAALNVVPSIYVFVSDFDTALEGIRELEDHRGNRMLSLKWNYEFDTQIDSEKQVELSEKLGETFREFSIADSHGIYSYICDSREEQREGFYSLYGSLFFLGILLSVVFIFAAVLIIYYKQISEGYEDQARFDIMQKVGMTKKEIRKSINSQLLMVFFMPLIGAGMHLAFAFPIIRKLLLLFNLNNVTLFAVVTLISFVVFALFYTLVYRATSNAYYNIVSGAKER